MASSRFNGEKETIQKEEEKMETDNPKYACSSLFAEL
jgi:hypothetical protein